MDEEKFNNAIKALQDAVKPKQEICWLDFSEHDPEESGYYFVYNKDYFKNDLICIRKFIIAYWDKKKEQFRYYDEGENISFPIVVTHFMPIPSLPKED